MFTKTSYSGVTKVGVIRCYVADGVTLFSKGDDLFYSSSSKLITFSVIVLQTTVTIRTLSAFQGDSLSSVLVINSFAKYLDFH